MAKSITSEQLEEIMAASERGLDEYNEVLRQIAGIEVSEEFEIEDASAAEDAGALRAIIKYWRDI